MTSYDIAAIVRELDSRLGRPRVSNIYQTNSRLLLLKLHQKDQGTLWLLVEPGRRLHLSSFYVEKPGSPPQFCRNLRKYLRNSTLTSIKQIHFERIIELTFDCKRTEYKLMIELFGKGNIILVDPTNKILHAMNFRRMKDRNIVRGESFALPPPIGTNPWTLPTSIEDAIHNMGDLEIVRGLTRVFSIGGLYAEELLLRSNIDKESRCMDLNREQFSRFLDTLEAMRRSLFQDKLTPNIILNSEGEWIDVVPIHLKKYGDLDRLVFDSFNEACDEYFAKRMVQEEQEEESEDEKAFDEQQRILEFQRRQDEVQTKKAQTLKETGDLIYLHYPELSDILQKIQADLDLGKSPKEILEEILSNKPNAIDVKEIRLGKTRTLELEINETKISLNLNESVQSNADRYYSKAKESRRKLDGLGKAIEVTETKIKDLTSTVTPKVSRPKILRKRKRLQWYEKFRWFLSSNGFLAVGGRDASTNEILIKKHMTSRDLVVHAEISGAPFVLVKTEGREVPSETLREACQFAVSTSRAWRLGLGSADAYWVRPDQISSAPPPGQYMAKGMFMVYGPRNHIHGIPLRLAIGFIEEEEGLRLIGGPPSSISSQTKYFVEFVPGNLTSQQLASEIRSALVRLVPSQLASQVVSTPLDDFQRFLPPGRGRISKAKK
ncbi:MAG: NFACT family protein [Candidatus Bathyarchaeota archaeon]|nr:MAG: NFACT family protein [Candidatus Bathyarchaeota archaeon]